MVSAYGGDHLDFRGGEFTGPFTAKAEYREHAPAPSALDALPARAVGFAGRGGELRELSRALDPSESESEFGGGSEAVVVAAVSGLGGIGKTALAVQAGHEACGRGRFPGGVLFVDLHGYDEEPVTAGQALEALLRALGTEPEHIPAGLDARAALYRSALAVRGRERGAVLILADNASSPAQVRPLLPGGGAGHRLLVTSRDRLPQLGARLLALDELTPEESYDLLDRALRIAHPGDSRVTDDPEEAGRLAVRCGYLPLALQIVAALLVVDRDKPVAELTAELGASRDLLGHLDDGERSVRAAFDLSYRRLSAQQAQLIRLLALAPGPEVTSDVVAVLTGDGDEGEADASAARTLEALARAHLVQRGSGRRRWRMHDLVRAYGVSVGAAHPELVEEGQRARERVLGFYGRRARAAQESLMWRPGGPEVVTGGERAAVLAWFDREREGLLAAVQWVQEPRFAEPAASLADQLREYLQARRYFDDWITMARTVQRAARRSGNRRDEARAWNSLGSAVRQMGRGEESIEAHTRARDLFRSSEDSHQEAMAANGLGIALTEAGRLEEAIQVHTRNLDLFRALGDRWGEGVAWTNFGGALHDAGRTEEAIEAHTHACDLLREVGDRLTEAAAGTNLASALRQNGRWDEAIEIFQRTLAVHREFEDWYGEGNALHDLARAHEDAHRLVEAREHWLRAEAAFTRANAPNEAAEARAAAASLTP
ncbi:tetratricopeptide repeat protein [Streptomyces xylophagus]|uniref:tetratricopeptide repeat protein n=1 Tax=Streptomyces xylophagus TaxID=285514 RepID=UPI0005BDC175|nr:tetratricopeptide repeat protein [Streptomyces xylophagus]